MISGSVLGGTWVALALGKHAKVHSYLHSQGWHPFDAESVSESASGRTVDAVFKILPPIRAPIRYPFEHFWQTLGTKQI